MRTQNTIEITSVELIDRMVLQVQFDFDWTMEDCTNLTEKLLLLTAMEIVEVIQGADLKSIRLKRQSYEFLLNFEEYSHSCWFECITAQDQKGLLAVQQQILHSMS